VGQLLWKNPTPSSPHLGEGTVLIPLVHAENTFPSALLFAPPSQLLIHENQTLEDLGTLGKALYDAAQPVEFLHLGLRAHRRRCVTNRPAAAEMATRGMSIRRNDQLIRYSPLTTVASTPKAMIRMTPIGTRKDGRSKPRIKPMTRPLATGSSSSTITHLPLAVGSSHTTSATKPSALRPLAGASRTLVTSFTSQTRLPTQSSVANVDESAMNLEGVGLFFRHYFDFPPHFCLFRSELRRECSFPINRYRRSCIESVLWAWPSGEPHYVQRVIRDPEYTAVGVVYRLQVGESGVQGVRRGIWFSPGNLVRQPLRVQNTLL
jgi:hypothetical protein